LSKQIPRFLAITRSGTIPGLIAALVLIAGPAAAGGVPGSGGLPPIPNPQLQRQRQSMATPVARGPHPTTYSEQVAQSLGVRDGRFDLIAPQARNPYVPSLSMSSGMLRLRWNR